jgi:autotransporter-associated beta strand protein
VEVRGGTTASPSTLTLSPSDPLSTTGYTGGRVYVAPAAADVAVLNQTAGTVVANILTIGEAGQATYNFSGGVINTGKVEFAYNGGGPNGPVEMNISSGAQLNVHNNGQILMGNYYGQRSLTVTQTGGTVAQFSDAGITRGGTGTLKFGSSNQNLTWNLSGGTLSIAGMEWQANTGSGFGGGNGVLNLNGGVLQITSDAFTAPTGEANGKPKVAAMVFGDEFTPDSGAIFDNYGLEVDFAAPILNGGASFFDGGLRLSSSVPGGSLTLQGANTYTGTTTVDAGNTLVLDSGAELRFLIDGTTSNKLTGAGTATLNGIFNIDTTFGETTPGTEWTLVDITNRTYGGGFSVAGFSNDGGVWTLDDGFGSLWTFTQSTGVLEVAEGAAGGYNSWITGFSLDGEDQPGDDSDKDGLDNLLEFVLNGDPSVSDSSILPALNVTATDFEFTYQRRDDSIAPETTQTFEWGTTLGAWPGSAEIPASSGTVGVATITVTPGVPDDGVTDTVKVSIPKSEAGGSGKLFGRLNVVKP